MLQFRPVIVVYAIVNWNGLVQHATAVFSPVQVIATEMVWMDIITWGNRASSVGLYHPFTTMFDLYLTCVWIYLGVCKCGACLCEEPWTGHNCLCNGVSVKPKTAIYYKPIIYIFLFNTANLITFLPKGVNMPIKWWLGVWRKGPW